MELFVVNEPVDSQTGLPTRNCGCGGASSGGLPPYTGKYSEAQDRPARSLTDDDYVWNFESEFKPKPHGPGDTYEGYEPSSFEQQVAQQRQQAFSETPDYSDLPRMSVINEPSDRPKPPTEVEYEWKFENEFSRR